MTLSPLSQPSTVALSSLARESAKISALIDSPALSCVIPACNESANLRLLIPQLAETLATLTTRFEIVVVDDGSTDDTAPMLIALREKFPLKCVFLSRNFGKEAALTAGLDEATGDAVILMDADLQHPVSMLPEFVAKWREGYEMVYGVVNNRAHESFIKRTLTRGFYALLRKAARIPIQPDAGDFRLLDRKVVESLKALPERNRFMKGLYAWVGYKSVGVPFQVEERRTGLSKFKFKHLTRLALAGMVSFSELPLRLSAVAGLLISLLSMSYGLYIAIRTLIFGVDLPGWATLIVAITFLNGIQLLAIGVVGEYIASIFNEVKGRPNYVVARRLGLPGERRV